MTAVRFQHLEFEIENLKTYSANKAHAGVHWHERKERAHAHRNMVGMYWCQHIGTEPIEYPVAITLTRISPGTLDDDNLSGGLKSIRDGVTDCLMRTRTTPPVKDDRDPRIVWDYDQASRGRGVYAVNIQVQGLSLNLGPDLGETQTRLTLKLRDQMRKANR